MLQAKQIFKKYGSLQVLNGVDISIEKGEIVSIIGSSGAGKSTLLHILGTLDTADSGEILFNEQPIHLLSGKKLAQFRNTEIGFIFQFHHLLPEFTALENICIPAWIAGTNKKNAEKRAIDLLEKMGLSNKAEHKHQQLSGGEQQRVAVARALINNPSIVFADEPTGNLDSKNAIDLHNIFVQLSKELQQTFLIVTHNQDLAALSNRVLKMKDGKMVS
ncbi:MAG: ABC transporter ATP-binding protein [Chitinophagaceae bacterium]